MSTSDNPVRVRIRVPPLYSVADAIDRNEARQLLTPSQIVDVDESDAETQLFELADGQSARLIRRKSRASSGTELFLPLTEALTDGLDLTAIESAAWIGRAHGVSPDDVLSSLAGAFTFRAADGDAPGLRAPQLGGLHSVIGYWTTDPTEPATVVMPTGTGKTETMVALFAHECPRRLLVLVPSDTLRTQVAQKFETYGVLQTFDVIGANANRPVVGRLGHAFSTVQNAIAFAAACNVVVATPQALAASSDDVRSAFLGEFTHLFVDEAHHVAAETWRRVRDAIASKLVVQFTATPYREDGRHLGGRLVYAFPLREAQRQGYFSTINYVSVVEFEAPDRRIAEQALLSLRGDLEDGKDHILMARVRRIGRAADVRAIYEELAPDLRPVVVHSTTTVRSRQEALAALRSRESRILVCVDMFGEGFDLPALKVAAIHDPHKTLGITLQFVGRFARTGDDSLGEATVVVGRPEMEFDDNLRKLYSEDADWNTIIRDLSEGAVQEQQEASDFEQAFSSLPEELTLHNLLPKMSTVVYKTAADDWDPMAAALLFSQDAVLTWPVPVNQRDRVAWFVIENRADVSWGDIRSLEETTYDLFVLYWDEARGLLFLNSSNTSSFYEDVAKAALGETVSRIRGEHVYRAMGHIQRLVPTNVGVVDIRNRARRFSMYAGADVSEGFPTAEAATKTKTNIFAYGYENGDRISIGASLKGRVWSYRVALSLKEWIDWCDVIGTKLLDETISVDDVMESFIRPEVLEDRPPLVALSADWPWEVFLSTSEETKVEIAGEAWPLVDADLEITSFDATGPIEFAVVTPTQRVEYRARFEAHYVVYEPVNTDASIVSSRSHQPLQEFLARHGLTFHLEQDATIVPPGLLLRPLRELEPFPRGRIEVLDWTGVDRRKESQGAERSPDSVQARALGHLLTVRDWDVVIDDDGTGEIADLVALSADEDELQVTLVHCKFSAQDTAGARVSDLYELCGQAQKSVRWRRRVDHMFRQLIRRERTRIERHGRSGMMKGDASALHVLHDRARLLQPRFTIALVQPGLSKAAASEAQLDLLASTEMYLHETALATVEVYGDE